ncbi:hypothetical protein K488DRAFT_88052 [Vararia minispora EC-137]|uniref:Uncharacterized protein n=1 Tax=Vararia minispora EC-137 TaxID=1314806 RepID=A0ACB8QEV9_9AGAM|nr:hypothetical protein K488DRAFT_88052 [Vararia minispora EC-137]
MHRFPVEILTHIFQLAMEISYASGHVKDTWAALHVVCRRWYQIMLTHGGLASDIRITDEHWDVDFATHLLERSSPYSIHLTMVLENRARNIYTIQQLEAFAEHVMTNHRTRIQSMVVGRSGFYADLRNLLLVAHFPNLRHLTIGSHLLRLNSLNADELARVTPALITLSLASTTCLQQSVGKDHPIFLNLVSLELMGSPSKHDMTQIPWDFLKVIGRIPALKTLILSDYFPESTRPSAIQAVVLPASIKNIGYLSRKPTRSVMDLDALLLHVIDVVAGALRNVEERALHVDKPASGPDLQGADERHSGGDRRARLEISITVLLELDVVDLRLASGESSVFNIRMKNVNDHLAFAIACFPMHEIRKMFVYSHEPVRVLWQYLKQSRTLVELRVVGRSGAEFVKLFEQDSKAFPALRDVSLMDNGDFSPELLLRALARRHAEGVRQVDALAIPKAAGGECVVSFERAIARSDAGPKLMAEREGVQIDLRAAPASHSTQINAQTPKDRRRHMAGHLDLSNESLQQLASMLRDDPTLRADVGSLMANRVEAALLPYFSNPPQFRTALGNARAVLSGSWVLHLIMTYSSTNIPSWTEGDLDVYCHEDGLAIVMACLFGEGYVPDILAMDDLDPPSKSSNKRIISRVLKFRHEERGRKIDIVCTHAATPFEVVLDFWTTLVMNVVTVHDLTVLYPDLTLSKQGTALLPFMSVKFPYSLLDHSSAFAELDDQLTRHVRWLEHHPRFSIAPTGSVNHGKAIFAVIMAATRPDVDLPPNDEFITHICDEPVRPPAPVSGVLEAGG